MYNISGVILYLVILEWIWFIEIFRHTFTRTQNSDLIISHKCGHNFNSIQKFRFHSDWKPGTQSVVIFFGFKPGDKNFEKVNFGFNKKKDCGTNLDFTGISFWFINVL